MYGKISKYTRRDSFVGGSERWKKLSPKENKQISIVQFHRVEVRVMDSEIEKKKTWAEFYASSKSKDYYSIE